MSFRSKLLTVIAALLTSAALTSPAQSKSCGQLWHARNSIYADAGYCFQTPEAIATFGPGCFEPYGRLSGRQQRRVNDIIRQERRQGC